ncbi:TPA: hypothetical protein N0F65_008522 [Lagenidium giganteum]|uniref:Major facilitator superfamily (MFS) profile domain-containing protein n=1 Tax=Lagenidium giganteum TaxID=4803 RepID=A0AAV2Z478_9STRA|nr:TPA: hypothetical protein N0F65_008522 [Lagenidium giganteum]
MAADASARAMPSANAAAAVPVCSKTHPSRSLRVLYVVSFLDLFAVSLIIPSLASYIKGMDGGAMLFGFIMSMYGFIQFFSAPIAGSLSDVYGRRTVLLVCMLGAACGYFMLALSWNIYIVILSRIPSAMFKHTLDLIKVAITDGEEPANRSAAVGRLNAVSNAGFIVGPMIGGYVSSFPNGFNYTALLTTLIFGVNYVLISLYYLDGTTMAMTKKADDPASAPHPDWRQIMAEAMSKVFEFKNALYETGPAKTLLLARLLLAMSAILYRSHFSVMLEDKFGTDSRARGMLLGYMGFVGAVGSASVGLALKWIPSERMLLQLSSVVYVVTFFALSQAATLQGIYIMLVPQIIAIRCCEIAWVAWISICLRRSPSVLFEQALSRYRQLWWPTNALAHSWVSRLRLRYDC